MKSTDEDSLKLAQILWDYHVLDQPVEKSDCIITLGSKDIRTAQKASELFMNGFGNPIVFTGGFGRMTKDSFEKPEAHIFADEAKKLGVPEDKILIEDKSTNTFDNIRFTKKLLHENNLQPTSFLVVTKPYMERRAYATFCSVWPDVKVNVASPDLSFTSYPDEKISVNHLINMLVGDHQRLMIFSESGFIAKQDIPDEVMSVYKGLIKLGYVEQLIPEQDVKHLLANVTAGNNNQ